MNQTVLRLVVAAFILGLTACGSHSLEDIAKKVAMELGVEVKINAAEYDECVYKQLKAIGAEYRKLDSNDRQRLKNRLSESYDTLTVETTQVSVRRGGTLTDLALFQLACNKDNCWYEELRKKTLVNDTREEGAPQSTTIESLERELTLRTYAKHDSYEVIEMMTTKKDLYAAVKSVEDPIYRDSLEKKAIHHRRTIIKNEMTCQVSRGLLKGLLAKN